MKRTHLISATLAALLLAASSLALADGPRHGGHGYRDHGPKHGAAAGYRHAYGHGARHGARHGYREGYRHGSRHGHRYGRGYGHAPRHRHDPHCRHGAYLVVRPGLYVGPPIPPPYHRPYPGPYTGGHLSLYFDF